MRRIIVGGLALLAIAAAGGVASRRLCQSPIDVRAQLLVAARDLDAAAAAAAPTDGTTTGPRALLLALRRLAATTGSAGTRTLLAAKSNDALAYPAHLTLARLLGRGGCSPEAVAVQYAKAAVHARTPADFEHAAAAAAAGPPWYGDAEAARAWLLEERSRRQAPPLRPVAAVSWGAVALGIGVALAIGFLAWQSTRQQRPSNGDSRPWSDPA